MKFSLLLILVLLSLNGSTQKNGIFYKSGDLLFQDIDCGPFCEAIEKVTSSYKGARFSHVGIVEVREDGSTWVWEAAGAGVVCTSIDVFMAKTLDSKGNPKVAWGRTKGVTKRKANTILAYCQSLKGKPYDDVFDIKNDAYYCSELVYFAFKSAFKKEIFTLEPMTFKDTATRETFHVWQNYYNDLGQPIPEGKPGLNPGGISRSKKVRILKMFYEIG